MHGHFPTLEKLLKIIKFDSTNDRLFSVGDLIDKGPASEQALEWINNRFDGVTKGNHERGVMDYFRHPKRYPFLTPDEQWIEKIPLEAYPTWARTLNGLPTAITVNTNHGAMGIVHADAPTRQWDVARKLFEESTSWDNIALLGFDEGPPIRAQRRQIPIKGIRALVHGHLPHKEVDHADNRWGIDTGAGSPALERLTIMEISSETLDGDDK